MPDVFTKAKRSAVMARIRSAGNESTELRLAGLMRAAGIRGWRRGVRLQFRVSSSGFRVGEAGSAAVLGPQRAPRTPRKKKGQKGPDSVRSVSSVVSASAISAPSVVYPSGFQPFTLKPDFVFRREKVAVFVDGCFWHGCPRHVTWPRQNAAFWRKKIQGNRARDRRADRALRAAGSPRSSRYRAAVRGWACAENLGTCPRRRADRPRRRENPRGGGSVPRDHLPDRF